jgi:hypothetical protein
VTWCYGDSREVCHLVRLHVQFLAAESACACSQDEVEYIFCVNGQSAELRAMDFGRFGDGACLAAVAVKGEAAQFGGCNINGVPFKDYGCLGGVSAAKNRG